MRFTRTLSGKLTLVYALLFAAVLALLFAAMQEGIARYSQRVATNEMSASADIFQRSWTDRYRQMHSDAEILAQDFGFRRAAATADRPTILSALDNLARRGGRPLTMFVAIDGTLVSAARMPPAQAARLHAALEGGREAGILKLGAEDFGAVAVPVRAPTAIGWVVFGEPLGRGNLAQLSGAPAHLDARVVRRDALPRRLRNVVPGRKVPVMLPRAGEPHLLRAVPLGSLTRDRSEHLLILDFSLAAATAEYRSIFVIIGVIGAFGLVVVSIGSWGVARRITRPIGALDRAVQSIGEGARTKISVESRDEIGRLATSFNAMVEAISEREAAITHMAFHDALTGLPNRKLFRERADMALEDGGAAAVLAIDLDQFKGVNDTLGHPIGDRFLCEIAGALREACGAHFVSRLGGDEFAVLVAGADCARAAEQLARCVLKRLAVPVEVGGHQLLAGASIGIAVAPSDGRGADELFKNADLALYRVKATGRGNFRFFEPAMDAAAQRRRLIETDLRTALDRGEFELYFQPLFHLRRNRICSFEALLRWHHPQRGLVSPADFIPIAEDTGLILPIGEWVVENALAAAAQWPEELSVAVNVSAVQFRSPQLVPMIGRALQKSGVAPQRLEIEVTESLFIENLEDTLSGLETLRAVGVRVALDDFGTGYSSLSYLRKFPFDKIKIDRSFIADLETSESASKIVRAITQLAAALGMETTAEGVEDDRQVALIRDQGCTSVQGFYFSRPVPFSHVLPLLEVTNGRAENADTRLASAAKPT